MKFQRGDLVATNHTLMFKGAGFLDPGSIGVVVNPEQYDEFSTICRIRWLSGQFPGIWEIPVKFLRAIEEAQSVE